MSNDNDWVTTYDEGFVTGLNEGLADMIYCKENRKLKKSAFITNNEARMGFEDGYDEGYNYEEED